jgi:hypothetical protein
MSRVNRFGICGDRDAEVGSGDAGGGLVGGVSVSQFCV